MLWLWIHSVWLSALLHPDSPGEPGNGGDDSVGASLTCKSFITCCCRLNQLWHELRRMQEREKMEFKLRVLQNICTENSPLGVWRSRCSFISTAGSSRVAASSLLGVSGCYFTLKYRRLYPDRNKTNRTSSLTNDPTVTHLLLGDERGALTVHGVVGEVVREGFGSIPRRLPCDAFRELLGNQRAKIIKKDTCWARVTVWVTRGGEKYLQVGDGGFVSFHPDDALCSQVLLPVRDQ